MSLIEECYASGKGVYVDTVEATFEGQLRAYQYCSGFIDRVLTTEDGRTLTFEALAMDIALPKNDNSGFQSLTLAMDNQTGEVQEAIEQAKREGKRVTVYFRRYLATDPNAPAERYRMSVLGREYEDEVAQLNCGFFDMLNTTGNRTVLTTNLAPGLKYI